MIEGSACRGANWRPVLDLQVNGSRRQAYRDWWVKWRVKACSISAPRGDMGLDAAWTHWPLPDRFWTLLWCKLGDLHDYMPLGVQANGCNSFFAFTDLTTIFSLRTKKAKSKDLDRTMSSTFQPCSGERVCFFVFFLVGCVSPAWEYHEIINRRWLRHLIPVPLIHQCSHHHQSKQTRDLRKSVEDISLYSLTSTGYRWLIP